MMKTTDLQVCKSAAGYYIGILYWDYDFQYNIPYSRESLEYYTTKEDAEKALAYRSFTPTDVGV